MDPGHEGSSFHPRCSLSIILDRRGIERSMFRVSSGAWVMSDLFLMICGMYCIQFQRAHVTHILSSVVEPKYDVLRLDKLEPLHYWISHRGHQKATSRFDDPAEWDFRKWFITFTLSHIRASLSYHSSKLSLTHCSSYVRVFWARYPRSFGWRSMWSL